MPERRTDICLKGGQDEWWVMFAVLSRGPQMGSLWLSTDGRDVGLILGSSHPCAEVSLGKILNPKLPHFQVALDKKCLPNV